MIYNDQIWHMLQQVNDARGDVVVAQAFDYAARLARGKIPFDELVSIAYFAVAKAEKNHDGTKGDLLPYAWPYIRGEVYMYWREDWHRHTNRGINPLIYVADLAEDSELLWVAHPREPEIDPLEWIAENIPVTEYQMDSLYRHYYEGRSLREIARMRGLSETRIADQMQRIHQKIKRKLCRGLK